MPARLLLLLSLLVCAAVPARADEPPLPEPVARFGAAGELVPSSGISFSYEHFDSTLGSPSSYEIGFDASPNLLYFVGGGFAVGGALDFSVQTYSSTSTTEVNPATVQVFGAGPLFAYNAPLSERVSFFPVLGLTVAYAHESFTNVSSTVDSLFFNVGRKVNLLFHPVPHFFVGGGPTINASFYTDSRYENRFTVGAGTTIGAWF